MARFLGDPAGEQPTARGLRDAGGEALGLVHRDVDQSVLALKGDGLGEVLLREPGLVAELHRDRSAQAEIRSTLEGRKTNQGANWKRTTPSLPVLRRGSRAERKRAHSSSRTSTGMSL